MLHYLKLYCICVFGDVLSFKLVWVVGGLKGHKETLGMEDREKWWGKGPVVD